MHEQSSVGAPKHAHKKWRGTARSRALLPHHCLSGLLFTINPRQDARAAREVQLYLQPLLRDVMEAHRHHAIEHLSSFSTAYPAIGRSEDEDGGNPAAAQSPCMQIQETGHRSNASGPLNERRTQAANDLHAAVPTTSSLLAAELLAATSSVHALYGSSKRSRERSSHFFRSDKSWTAVNSVGGCGAKDEEVDDGGGRDEEPLDEVDEWLRELRTNCKGYLLVRVPCVNPHRTCYAVPSGNEHRTHTSAECRTRDASHNDKNSTIDNKENNSGSNTCDKGEDCVDAGCDGDDTKKEVVIEAEQRQRQQQESPKQPCTYGAHTTVINPLVAWVVHRIFDDMRDNPRPIFRNCFRMYPVELTCCPTVSEMQAALRTLLALHFPSSAHASSAMHNTCHGNCAAKDTQNDSVADVDKAASSLWSCCSCHTTGHEMCRPTAQDDKRKVWVSTDFDQPLPFPTAPASPAVDDVPVVRSMHVIGVQLMVKNNTAVAERKAMVQAALNAVIPVNRFIVIPPGSGKRAGLAIEAMICVVVMHSTCCIGVQRAYVPGGSYNIHAMGARALDLTNAFA